MHDTDTLDAYGALTAPATLTIRRLLPGPIERVWAYLTDGELRRQWLAAGAMELRVGAPFELVWRNDTLSETPSPRPEGFAEEHRLASRITACEPPHLLAFAWGEGEVTFALAPQGTRVMLTVTHARVADRATLLKVSAGWHAHLDVLATRAAGGAPPPFWPTWQALRAEYERRLPG